jgi:putative tryptophan/tyrosine transport system substrate-binding protein
MTIILLILAMTLNIVIAPLYADAQLPGKVARVGYLKAGSLTSQGPHTREAFRQGLRDLGWVNGQNLALGIVLTPPAAGAQPLARVVRIGFLGNASAFATPLVEAFRQGLREQGWVEGQTIAIEFRWAEGELERLPDLAAELVRLKVDVIVTSGGTPVSLAVKQATDTIPIVMTVGADPVGTGLVASLARPGGNITGLTLFTPELEGKRLELLKELVPGISRVAVLANPVNPATARMVRETEVAAQALSIPLQPLEVRDPGEFEGAFAAMTSAKADALIVLPDPMLTAQRTRIVELAAKHRLPAMYGFREDADAGGLMAYATDYPDLLRRAAAFVDKILKGAKPADLPVEQATKFELIINLKTAKALGLTISPLLLFQADEVIQ